MDNNLIQALEEGGVKFLTPEEIEAAQSADGGSGDQNTEGSDQDQGGQQQSQQSGDDGGGNGDGSSDGAGDDDGHVFYTPADEDGSGAGDSGQSPSGGEGEPSEEEVRSFVNEYIQESLGMTLEEIQSLKSSPAAVDESIKPILDFVQKTGRSPEEWFVFQQMDPSKMDDQTVLKMDLMKDFPDLSPEEAQMLIESKYKIGDEMVEDRERKLLDVQLKMDSQKARKSISELRDAYTVPKNSDTKAATPAATKIANDTWLKEAEAEIEALEGVDFEIGDKTFTFGLNGSAKNNLKSKSAQIDNYLQQYQTSDGRFNHELFNVHQVVLSNIDEIVKAVYNQGISDGQRKLVSGSANVGSTTPKSGSGVQKVTALEEQIAKQLGGDSGMMRIKF